MSQIFQHKPLAKQSTQIRLIQVVGNSSEVPVCTIVNVDLKSNQIYQALSYAWGEDNPAHEIKVNGEIFYTRSNLYVFLQTYQNNTRPVDRQFLWIDQLCIDQNNTAEKNSQVQLMADIYRSGSEVVAWLGPATEHTQLASWVLRLLECDYKLLHEYKDINRDQQLIGSPRQFFEDLMFYIPARRGSPYPSPTENGVVLRGSCRAAIRNLLQNRYWTRLWVVQEIMLAQNLIVWWGTARITREGLVGLTEKIRVTYRDDVVIEWSHLHMILTQARHREIPLGHVATSTVSEGLQSLLNTFCGYGCFDPKDKVFGLMGVVRKDSAIVVDYTQSVKAVYLTTVRTMGEGVAREVVRLRLDPSMTEDSWRSYLDTCWKLGVEMLPGKFVPLLQGCGQDGFCIARRLGIDLKRFVSSMSSEERPQYMLRKLDAVLC